MHIISEKGESVMSADQIRELDKKLAFNSAPALLGIKCASLLSLGAEWFEVSEYAVRFNKRLESRGLKLRLLCECRSRVLVFVYNERLLKARLADKRVAALLSRCGYDEAMSLEELLDRLSCRIKADGDFPHEIGAFLGYPIDDVLGFIENGGENYKLCGCWKVYSDTEGAVRAFRSYERCREHLCSKLNKGLDIYQALGI